jgi:hypothetical protein
MKRISLLLAATFLGSLVSSDLQAGHPVYRAHADRGAYWHNANHSWHGAYQHVQYGHPLALIVPPTANMQTEYSWGVGRTMMRPIHHQFGRPVATPGYAGGTRPTPMWPSSTEQLGVYSVRGPW